MRKRKEYKVMRINIPENAKKIIDVLYDNGYEAYVVGGCVRDSLLGLEPKDWDITTSAAPQVVKSLFNKTIDTGIEHGTVTVMYGKEGYEVTTYRIDGEYKDSRRPESVEFTSDLAEDLLRRDFTINAMAYNDKVGVVGTINLDYRSLVHHYECGVFMVNNPSILDIKEDFIETQNVSIEIPKDFKLNIFISLLNYVLKFFTPLL
jgi:hypothetical protein